MVITSGASAISMRVQGNIVFRCYLTDNFFTAGEQDVDIQLFHSHLTAFQDFQRSVVPSKCVYDDFQSKHLISPAFCRTNS